MKMEIFFSVVWPTVHRPVKIVNENASFYKCYLQSEDFWQRRFPVLLIEKLCQRRRRRQRKRHCLTDFSVGRDFFDWCKISVECRWICLKLNSWGPPPSLEREREICSLVFTSSIKLHLREFYVAVVQWRQRNFVQKSVLHVQTVVVLQR